MPARYPYRGQAARWNDMSRGATHWIKGPDEDAKALGINPVLSGARVEDEGLYPVQHGYWVRAMRHAVDLEAKAQPTPGTSR